jgi:hypothetical protein
VRPPKAITHLLSNTSSLALQCPVSKTSVSLTSATAVLQSLTLIFASSGAIQFLIFLPEGDHSKYLTINKPKTKTQTPKGRREWHCFISLFRKGLQVNL